jgi:diacylglycerol kinase family enzyme/membrane-associated phospholipid phosphatase
LWAVFRCPNVPDRSQNVPGTPHVTFAVPGSVPEVLRWLRRAGRRIDHTDRALTRWIARLPRTRADTVLKALTTSANHSGLWFSLAALLAMRRGATRRAALRGVLAISGASFTANAIAKPLLPRRRPAADALPGFRTLADHPRSSSFPSGHAASAAAFTTAVATECPLAGALIAPLAATVAYSRVHTGPHWPSDVMAGAALGTGVALATRRWWPVRPITPAMARPLAGAPALPDGDGVTVMCNPRSGSPGVDPTDEVRAVLPKARIVLPQGEADLASQLDAALDAAIDQDTEAVGVAGGDGSVAATASVALRRELPLVVLPTGTLNHFARDVGIDSVEDTARAVGDGRAVAVDLASVTVDGSQQRPFLNTASMGGYPDLVRIRERWQHRWGKWPAAAYALMRVLAAASPLSVRINGRPMRVWVLFVGNSPYHPRGMAPAYRPRLDTGLLDVRYLRADLRLSRTRFIIGAITGALLHSRTYVQCEVPSLRVQVDGRPVALATDGEVGLTGRDFTFAVAPTPLAVYRP